MKKIFLITVLTLFAWFSSCKKFVEKDQVSPNNPVTAGASQFLLVSEVATFESITTNLDRTACVLTQQLAGIQFQMQSVAEYDIKEGDNQDDWYTCYDDALINIQALIDKAGTANPYYRGIGEVLKAMNLGITTDVWGDVPDSGALKGASATAAAFNPLYEPQQSIYNSIQALLTAAIADLSQPSSKNTIIPGADDIIHNGDVSMWLKNAWVLKARYENHLSKKDPSGSATKALADIASSGMADDTSDMKAIYSAASNGNVNPWNSFQNERGQYVLMSKPFIDLLNSTSDPRLPFYAAQNPNGGYTGSPVDPDSADLNASDVGTYMAGVAAPIQMVTYYEAEFIAAEANMRLGNAGAAAIAYNNAVAASVLSVTGAPISASFKAAVGNETANTITLSKIMTQKYIAMFGNFEVWTDWRRTNIPKLNPCAAGVIPTIPRRFPTPLDERVYDKNAVVVDDITKPVWWDQ